MMELRKTALITGALGGIGVALVRTFAAAGYRVIATDRRPDDKGNLEYVQFDIARLVADDADRATTTANLHSVLGSHGLDVLVNNAAVQHLGGVDDVTARNLRDTFDTNVLGPLLLIQALLPDLEKAGGSVINISSIHASLTKPGFVAYATSKAALLGLTRALAVDLGSRVRVNCVLPAATDTPMLRAGFEGNTAGYAALASMHPMGRISSPDEVARVALFLASADASAVTGAALGVDGGIGGRLHDPA